MASWLLEAAESVSLPVKFAAEQDSLESGWATSAQVQRKQWQ